MVTSGDIRIVRVWDIQKEMRIVDLPTGALASVTTIDRQQNGNPHIFCSPLEDSFQELIHFLLFSNQMCGNFFTSPKNFFSDISKTCLILFLLFCPPAFPHTKKKPSCLYVYVLTKN